MEINSLIIFINFFMFCLSILIKFLLRVAIWDLSIKEMFSKSILLLNPLTRLCVYNYHQIYIKDLKNIKHFLIRILFRSVHQNIYIWKYVILDIVSNFYVSMNFIIFLKYYHLSVSLINLCLYPLSRCFKPLGILENLLRYL